MLDKEKLNKINDLKTREIISLACEMLKDNSESPQDLIKFALKTIQKGEYGEVLLSFKILYELRDLIPKQVITKLILKYAASPNWAVRETVGSFFSSFLYDDFKYYFKLCRKMVKSKNVNLRRATIIAGMNSDLTLSQMKKVVDEIYEVLLNDKELYIRKNLGPFALAHFFRRFPEMAERKINKWGKSSDGWTAWNTITIFSQSAGKRNPDIALKYIKIIGQKNNKEAISGCSSVIYNVAKYHPKKVKKFIKDNKNDISMQRIFNKSHRFLKKANAI